MSEAPEASPHSPLDPHAMLLREAAERAGIETRTVRVAKPGLRKRPHLRFTVGGTEYDFRSGALRRVTPENPDLPGRHINGRATRTTTSKSKTKAALAAAKLSVPIGEVFGRDELEEAVAYAQRLKVPVCVKPNKGKKGQLVFPDRIGRIAVAEAFRQVAEVFNEVLVEESVAGEELRFFYVEPHAVAVKLSVPPEVAGDGRLTVLELIAKKNTTDASRRLPNQKPIVPEHGLIVFLAEQGLKLESVAEPGRRVRLGRTANGTSGGGHVECRDSMHPSYWPLAEAAFRAVPGLVIGTLDMKVADRSRPAARDSYFILEINSSPGLLPYHRPWEGRPQDVCGAIIDCLRRRGTA